MQLANEADVISKTLLKIISK